MAGGEKPLSIGRGAVHDARAIFEDGPTQQYEGSPSFSNSVATLVFDFDNGGRSDFLNRHLH